MATLLVRKWQERVMFIDKRNVYRQILHHVHVRASYMYRNTCTAFVYRQILRHVLSCTIQVYRMQVCVCVCVYEYTVD